MSVTVANIRTQIADRPQAYPPMAADPEIIGTADGVATQFSLQFENFIAGTLTVYQSQSSGGGPAGQSITFTAINPTSSTIVGTTSTTAVPTPGGYAITPVSMVNISPGVYLLVDLPPNQEIVKVASVTGTTWTASFTLSHTSGFAIAGAPVYIVGAPNALPAATAATNQIVTFAAPPAAGTLIAARYQATAFSDADLATFLANAQVLYGGDDRTLRKATQFDIIDAILMDQRRLEMLGQGEYRRDPGAYIRALQSLKDELRKDIAGSPVYGSDIPALGVTSAPARRYQGIR